jgi:hypothetical protein
MGIIDYLQVYDGRKKVEKNFKNIMHFDIKGELASCQDPTTYSQKFQKAICDNYLVTDKSNTLDDIYEDD